MVRSTSPGCGLVPNPALEVGPKPEFDAPPAELNNWAGHVGVAALIETYAVAV